MRRFALAAAEVAIGLGIAWLLSGCQFEADSPPSLSLAPAAGGPDFKDALEPLEFSSPSDHGPHFAQIQWVR